MTRVYISSTFGDLEDYRRAVYHALRRMKYEVLAMEDGVATPRRPLEECLLDVARCDIYVGIFAWRYGFIPEEADPAAPGAGNPERKSITELEYLHAKRLGKRILIFLLDEKARWPPSLMDEGEGRERIRDLRRRLSAEHWVDFFTDDEGDLTTKVSTALSGDRPETTPAPRVNVARLPITDSSLFVGREPELKALEAAWADDDTHVVSLVGWGGVGKSALVNSWLGLMACGDYDGATHVYGWSFYDPDKAGSAASADQFIEEALAWFGDPRPAEGSPWEKGERLARLAGSERTLLLLDGLEPLQYPPGPDGGRVKEHALQALLRGLAAYNRGLCVVSTRIAVADLSPFEGSTHTTIDLDHLSPEAGARLLRALEVRGPDDELAKASEEFGGHPLALTLLGGYLADVYDHDVTRRDEVRSLEGDARRGGHARRVMESYAKWLGWRELAVLHMLGLFNRPADARALAELRAAPPIYGLTDRLFYPHPWGRLGSLLQLRNRKPLSEQDWKQVLANLRRAKLLAEENPAHPDVLDAHPLVREHFGQRIRRRRTHAWRMGHARLFHYLRNSVKKFPRNAEEASRLYAAVTHGCHAGLHKSAFDWVYYRRIQRAQRFYSANKFAGSVNADLDVLSCFFPNGWDEPVTRLRYPLRALLLGQAGYRLWMLGRLEKAIVPMQKACAADLRAAARARDEGARHDAWKYAAVDADTLACIHLALGRLSDALEYSGRAIEYARNGSDTHHVVNALNTRGDVQHHMGLWDEAEKTFREAEEIRNSYRPQPPPETKKRLKKPSPSFHNPLGYRYCDLLLSTGRYEEAIERLGRIQKSQEEHPDDYNLIENAMSYLLLGQARLARARVGGEDLGAVKDTLDEAKKYLRHAGQVVHLPRGLMALADWHLLAGKPEDALPYLEEAYGIAERAGMKLHAADCLLKLTRAYLAMGNRPSAGESWRLAREIVEETGYHRRDRAVEELAAALT